MELLERCDLKLTRKRMNLAPQPRYSQQHDGQAPEYRPRDSRLAESHWAVRSVRPGGRQFWRTL